MKHIKLFEDHMASQPNLLSGNPEIKPTPVDISKPGDTVFCWNIEDGWTVALANKEEAKSLFEALQVWNDLTLETKYSSGIAYVITEDLKISFVDPRTGETTKNPGYIIDPNKNFPVKQNTGNPESIIFSLKRGFTTTYRWNGGSVETMPISEYITSNGLDAAATNPDDLDDTTDWDM